MWILVDMSYLAHRARHTLKDLESEDMPTGVLFGFFDQLYSICSSPRFQSNKVLMFADSGASYRKDAYPEYKAKRAANRTEEEWKQIKIMHKQIKILRREVLPALGMPVYGQAGLESDDLLAIAAIQLAQQKQRGVMITSDGDLYQCINECVSWYDPMKDSLLNPQSFEKLKGVPPWEWGNVKAIGGCSTDNVAGLEGVGEKGAIQFLRNEMPSHYKKYSTIVKSWDSLEIEKWDALVMLPHKKTKPIRLREPDYKPEVFFDFCKEYDIDSYLEGRGRRRWEDFFEGRFNGAPRSRRRK